MKRLIVIALLVSGCRGTQPPAPKVWYRYWGNKPYTTLQIQAMELDGLIIYGRNSETLFWRYREPGEPLNGTELKHER